MVAVRHCGCCRSDWPPPWPTRNKPRTLRRFPQSKRRCQWPRQARRRLRTAQRMSPLPRLPSQRLSRRLQWLLHLCPRRSRPCRRHPHRSQYRQRTSLRKPSPPNPRSHPHLRLRRWHLWPTLLPPTQRRLPLMQQALLQHRSRLPCRCHPPLSPLHRCPTPRRLPHPSRRQPRPRPPSHHRSFRWRPTRPPSGSSVRAALSIWPVGWHRRAI